MPKSAEGYVSPATGAKIDEEQLKEEFAGKSVSFDAHDITRKIIEFGKILTGISLYKYQEEAVYAIIYSVITFSGDVKTMLFSRQSGKSEAMAFIVDTLCVILPALGKFMPDLEQFATGFRVGLFAPQSDQVQTTYSRAMTRMNSANAEMVLQDPDIDVYLESSARLELSNGSYLAGQVASKQSKIESKTYDLVIVEEAQDVDDLIVSKSIEPMLSSTAGTLIKVGTTGMFKNHFWYEIQHNRQLDRKVKDPRVRNHFEFDYKRIIKDRREQYEIDHKRFHLNYEADILRKKARWGEDSQSFKLAYALIWDLESGMLLTDKEYNGIINRKLGLQMPTNYDYVVAGLDIGKSPAETVLTIGKVTHSKDDPFDKTYKQVLAWVALGGLDYEAQHHVIMDCIVEFNISSLFADYTGVGKAVVDRLMYACGEYVDITPYTFTSQSKSDMWFNFVSEIQTKHLIVPANKKVRESTEYMKFEEQMKNCQKYFNGAYMVCEKSEGYFDDFVDSCLSSDTEVLTIDGFKGIDELTKDDMVASVDATSYRMTYQKPLRKVVKHYQGDMIHFNGEHFEQLISPHHRVLYERRTSKNGKSIFVKTTEYAEDVINRGFNSKFPVSVKVKNDEYPILDAEIKVLGWFITEAWISRYKKYPNYYRYSIGQSYKVNAEKCDEISSIFNELSLDPYVCDKKNGMRFWQFHKKDNAYFDTLLDRGCHLMPSYWRKFSLRQMKVLYEAMMEGDGHWSSGTYTTQSKELAYEFSEMCHIIGRACYVRNDFTLYKVEKHILYRCYVSRGGYKRVQGFELVPYDDRIWCVTVPTGYIVIRYNGKISVTGNCALMCMAANEEQKVDEEMEVTDNPLYGNITSNINALRRNSY